MDARSIILAFAALLYVTATTSAQPSYDNAALDRMCLSAGGNAKTCECERKAMQEMLTSEEINWAVWIQADNEAAIKGLAALMVSDKAKADRLVKRMGQAAKGLEKRSCDKVK